MDASEPQYLYLTTTGRVTGQPHTIEIWFVALGDCCYLVSERFEESHWVKNIRANPPVRFAVGQRDASWISGEGRALSPDDQPDLVAAVRARMDAKYGWSDGLIVELRPA
ncbi:MAG: nitroreductase/quinone reductase family protein [Anaerolineae bacterium]